MAGTLLGSLVEGAIFGAGSATKIMKGTAAAAADAFANNKSFDDALDDRPEGKIFDDFMDDDPTARSDDAVVNFARDAGKAIDKVWDWLIS